MIRFSIIIPNYNKDKYIKDCLDSVFNQTIDEKKIEVIVIDDGSTDNSLNIINKYNIKLFNTNNLKAGGARNKGLDNATGEYIVFLDSDDYFTSNDVLEKLDNIIKDEDLVFFNFTKLENNIYTLNEENIDSINDKIEKTKYLACYTKCYNNSLITNLRFSENVYYEDMLFVLEAMCRCKKYTYFKDSFVTYRKVNNSITTSDVKQKQMIDLIIQISSFYYLCDKYPMYKNNILNRIINDKLNLRLDILNEYLLTDVNNFRKNFPIK